MPCNTPHQKIISYKIWHLSVFQYFSISPQQPHSCQADWESTILKAMIRSMRFLIPSTLISSFFIASLFLVFSDLADRKLYLFIWTPVFVIAIISNTILLPLVKKLYSMSGIYCGIGSAFVLGALLAHGILFIISRRLPDLDEISLYYCLFGGAAGLISFSSYLAVLRFTKIRGNKANVQPQDS